MMALPFGPASFDIVTTGYGLRNVPDLAGAIDEMFRVLKPGGQALSLDFNRPANGLVRAAVPALPVGRGRHARLDPAPRPRHLPVHPGVHSAAIPARAGVARLMEQCGFWHVSHRPLLGGLMSLHHAVKP